MKRYPVPSVTAGDDCCGRPSGSDGKPKSRTAKNRVSLRYKTRIRDLNSDHLSVPPVLTCFDDASLFVSIVILILVTNPLHCLH